MVTLIFQLIEGLFINGDITISTWDDNKLRMSTSKGAYKLERVLNTDVPTYVVVEGKASVKVEIIDDAPVMYYNRPEADHSQFLTIYQAIGGWQSKLMFWDKEGGHWDVWQTGFGPYPKKEQAIADALCWSHAEELRFQQ